MTIHLFTVKYPSAFDPLEAPSFEFPDEAFELGTLKVLRDDKLIEKQTESATGFTKA
jgi:hypothetical protein